MRFATCIMALASLVLLCNAREYNSYEECINSYTCKDLGVEMLTGASFEVIVECGPVWKQCSPVNFPSQLYLCEKNRGLKSYVYNCAVQKCIAEYNTCQDNESPGENCSKVWTECSEKDDNEICTGNKEFLKDMRDCLQQLLQSPPPPSP